MRFPSGKVNNTTTYIIQIDFTIIRNGDDRGRLHFYILHCYIFDFISFYFLGRGGSWADSLISETVINRARWS